MMCNGFTRAGAAVGSAQADITAAHTTIPLLDARCDMYRVVSGAPCCKDPATVGRLTLHEAGAAKIAPRLWPGSGGVCDRARRRARRPHVARQKTFRVPIVFA